MWQDLLKRKANVQVKKDLVYILADHQTQNNVQSPFATAVEGMGEHIYVKRAEIELKRMIQQLMAMTSGAVYSPLLLSTVGLPYPISIVLWVTATLLEDESNEQMERFVEKRTHDSVKLLRSLYEYRQFLRDWWQVSIQRIPVSALPKTLKFPVGHPSPPKLYRQHPLPSKPDYYYPVNAYYPLLYEEREQELIRLLADLGATQISIQPLVGEHGARVPLAKHPEVIPSTPDSRVLQYSGRPLSAVHFDPSQYEWLDHEPGWQTVVDARIHYACSSAALEINLDIANTVGALLDGIESLSEQLTSVQGININILRNQILRRQLVQVEFGAG